MPTTREAGYAEAFEAAVTESGQPSAIRQMRRAAFDRFAALGFPTTANEDWHYTSVAAIAERDFATPRAPQRAPTVDTGSFQFGASDWHTIVLVNGRYVPGASSFAGLPAGVRVQSLAEGLAAGIVPRSLGRIVDAETQAFTALNTAFLDDGVSIEIDANVDAGAPIHIIHLADESAGGTMMHPRVVIMLGHHAKATVIESYVAATDAEYLVNAVSEVSLADGATLNHLKLQRESRRAFHVGTHQAKQERGSHYLSFSLAAGAALSRTNVYTSLDGENAGATLNGLYLLDGTQHADQQTSIVHAQPNCFSRELYKSVLDGSSRGVFNGKVYVHPIAQKTDGKQTNKTLLLSEKAKFDTKPQLEIFADDVKCTHGATIGQIDRTALFYLKSRGINAETARQLLTYAFAADVLETIECEPVRVGLEKMTLERFTTG